MIFWNARTVLFIVYVFEMVCRQSFAQDINTSCGPPRSGECIGIFDCPYFVDLLAKSPIPRPLGVVNEMRRDMCGFYQSAEGTAPKVCCGKPLKKAPQQKDSSLLDHLESHPNFRLLPTTTCGPIQHNFRIMSGSSTEIGEFPWMALIFYNTGDLIDFRCGGTLINKRYVLTAAHCIVMSEIIGVRLGEYNVSSTLDCLRGLCAPPTRDLLIEDTIVHSKYNPRTFQNDIALIRLTKDDVINGDTIRPVCLPFREDNLIGEFATVSGWGMTETGHRSKTLQKTSIPVQTIEHCQSIYQEYTEVTDNQICAGGSLGRDSCAGDSGGPLGYPELVDGTVRFVQHGIVSYGPRYCGTFNQPAVYTKIYPYMRWILDNLMD